MAERGVSFTHPLYDSMHLGARTPLYKAEGTPATSLGLGNLTSNAADLAVKGQEIVDNSAANRALSALRAPKAPAAPRRMFSPSTNQMAAGGTIFDARDVESALRSTQSPDGAPAQLPAGDWVPLPDEAYQRYIASLSQRRSIGENVALGARGAAEGLIGGVGRALEIAGATNVGPAMAEFAEQTFGQDKFEQQRTALIQQTNSTWDNIKDATYQGIPSMVGTILAGIAGAAVGGPVGGAVGIGATASRTIGIYAGVSAAVFPQELKGMYDSAVANGYDVNDPQVQNEMLGAAIGSTMIQSLADATLAKGLSPFLKGALNEAGKTVWRRTASGALKGGFAEATTEGLAQVIQQAAFDPTFRAQLSANDWKALAPYMVEAYGEQTLIAAGAGALLGGIAGGAGGLVTGKEVDLTRVGNPAPVPPAEEAPPPAAGPDAPLPPDTSPRALPYIPGAETIGARPVAPTGPEQVADPNRPLTLQQTGLMRGLTGGLRPEDRQSGNITVPGGDRNITLQGEVLDPVTAPGAARLRRGLPPPPPTVTPEMLAAPTAAQPNFTAGPEGVAPEGYTPPPPPPPAPPAAPPAQVGMDARPGALPAPPQGAMADQLRAIAERRAQQAQLEAQQTENNRLLEIQRRQRAAEIDEAYGQVDQQRATMRSAEEQAAYDALSDEQKSYVDADMAWEQFRPAESGITLADLTDRAQQQWVDAVRAGTADETLFTKLRKKRRPGPARPILDVPNIIDTPAPLSDVVPGASSGVSASQPGEVSTSSAPAVDPEPDPTPPKPTKGKALKKAKPTEAAAKPAPAPKAERVKRGPLAQAAPEAAPVAETTAPDPTAGPVSDQEPAFEIKAKEPPAEKKVRKSKEQKLSEEIEDIVQTTEVDTLEEQLAEEKSLTPRKIDIFMELMATRDNPETIPSVRQRVTDILETELTAKQLQQITAKYRMSALAENIGANEDALWLQTLIQQLNAGETDFNAGLRIQAVKAWDKVKASDPVMPDGTKMSDLIVGGSAFFNYGRVDGRKVIVPRVRRPGAFRLADWATAQQLRDLDGNAVAPMTLGAAQLKVRALTSRFARGPRVSVFRSQADLKARDPQLYARAKAARPKDFDNAPAAGYSFGDGEVILFTDRIYTDQQLAFVLAHEAVGHYGLRALLPADKFDAVMRKVYDMSETMQRAVDNAVATRGIGRLEAIEEYLADYAAVLETSVVLRVWHAIKGALNKLGIQFGDDMVRTLLDHSRRYVRTGKAGMFDVEAVGRRSQQVERGGAPGRFSNGQTLRAANLIAATMKDRIGEWPGSFEDAWSYMQGKGGDTRETLDNIKAKFLSLTNFRSRQNPGLAALEELLNDVREISMSIKVENNERLRVILDRAVEAFGAKATGGITKEQTARLNEMLYEAQRFAASQLDADQSLLDGGPLYEFKDGKIVPNDTEITRLRLLGRRSFKDMRDGFEYKVTYPEAGELRTETVRFKGFKDLTEDSPEWQGYLKLREAMEDIELRLLVARYTAQLDERNFAFREFADLTSDKTLSAADEAFLDNVIRKYNDLYTADVTFDDRGYPVLSPEAMKKGNDFLVAVNASLIGKDTDRYAAVRAFFDTKQADDVVAKLEAFKKRVKLGDDKFIVQNRIKQIVLSQVADQQADMFTKRTIAMGYTPILREGRYEVRVEAVNAKGQRVQLQDGYKDLLVYSQFETRSEAQEMAKLMEDSFGGSTFTAAAYDPDAMEFTQQAITLRPVFGRALDAVAAPPEMNLNEFIRGLRQFDIVLPPAKMEQVVTALTRQNHSARQRLKRAFVPGADMDAVMASSRHIESRASTIAKTIYRPRMAALMNLRLSATQKLWNGDETKLAALQKRVADLKDSPNARPEEIAYAQRELDRYAYMFKMTNPSPNEKRGMGYYNEAAGLMAFLDGNKNVDESDFGSGPAVSWIRATTSMVQLGGSVATGALNMLSLVTNGIPYLASYNHKTAFGGGFGMGKTMAALQLALRQVGGPGITSRAMNTATFYEEVAADPALQKRYKLKAHEARFIAREIKEGAMIPAQFNALVGSARGRMTSGFSQKFVDGWMWTFNVTEQASRRGLGLAAFRLEYDRQIAAGKSPADAEAGARKFAVDTLQFTMGEYSVTNRPPAWRSGIQSFLYMYKVFPTTSVQLLANMSRNGKIGMLAALWVLSGLAGMPFAEDMEDLVDTLAQRLGFAQGSIRYEIAKFIDGIFPGMSPVVLTGLVNEFAAVDIAGRTSLGDLFPGTGILLSATDKTREMMEIFGPAPSMLLGMAQTVQDIPRAVFTEQTTLVDVAREAPVTMVRALGDAYVYAQSGNIIDRRGYVVSEDVTVWAIIGRMLGFYPEAAAQEYQTIRIMKRMTDYQREMTAGFRAAWIKAYMAGDTAQQRDVEEAVKDWNEQTKGTALEIRNFVKNSQRALREAQRPAGERTLRVAPNAAEGDLRNVVDLLTN